MLCLFLVPIMHDENPDLPLIFTENSISSGENPKKSDRHFGQVLAYHINQKW